MEIPIISSKGILPLFVISQTLIKQFSQDGYCPKKIKALYIDRTHQLESESMNKGIYFETGCIGAGRDGKQLTELPKNKNGTLTAANIRIDQQILNWKKKIQPDFDINIHYTQHKLMCWHDEETVIEGVTDIIGTMQDPDTKEKIPVIIDLKLTGNIFNSYGDFCWAYPANMDHTQPFMYTRIANTMRSINLGHTHVQPHFKFFYFVFDYKPEPEFKIIQKSVSPLEERELDESIRKTKEKIRYYNGMGWDAQPNYKECKGCPLKDNCPASGKTSQFIEKL